MGKSLLITTILIIFLAQPIFAYTYLNIYIDSSGKAEFLGETNETNIIFPAGIFLQDGKIRGTTDDLTTKQGEIWTFSYSLKDAEIKVILPQGSTIKSFSNPQAEIFLERSRISIYFIDGLSVNYIIDDVKSSNTLLILAIILLAIGVAGYFNRVKIKVLFSPKIRYKKPRKKKSHVDMIKHILNPREQLILDKMKSTGKIKTSHLRRLCDIPKASFSRHIQELEKKKLVVRSGEGKNKFVELSKSKF